MFNRTSNGHSKESKAVVSAVVPQDDLLWSSIPPAVISELDTPIDPALVSQRKGRGGKKFSYIEGHTVIDEANRVFGYGGWGYDVVGDVTLREIDNVDTETGEVRRIRAYAANVRVTVPGAPPRSDIGFHAVVEDNADGHETAIKGAVTDGLKRALRTFGARFGNALYGEPQTGHRRGRRRERPSNRPEVGDGRSLCRHACSNSARQAGLRRRAGGGRDQGAHGQSHHAGQPSMS